MFTISKHGISISLSLRVRFSAYQLVKPRHFSLMCLYHPGKVSSDVFVSMVSLSTIFYSGFWSYSEFGILITVPTVWYSANCSDNMAYWNYSDNLVFLELFRQPNDFGAISTVWYFLFFIVFDLYADLHLPVTALTSLQTPHHVSFVDLSAFQPFDLILLCIYHTSPFALGLRPRFELYDSTRK